MWLTRASLPTLLMQDLPHHSHSGANQRLPRVVGMTGAGAVPHGKGVRMSVAFWPHHDALAF